MISHTHSECPGTMECLAWALGGADKAMIVIAFEMQLPAGGNAHGETHATGQTGVEMEALTGVSVALLTVYDMLKAVDKSMEITGIRLLEKDGGKSGHYIRNDGDRP